MKSGKDKSSGINDRAAEWVWKNDRGLTAAEQDAFTDWLGESAEHRQAYATHSSAWGELARLAGLQNTEYAPVVPDLLGSDNSPWYRKYLRLSKWSVAVPVAASLAFFAGYLLLNQNGEETIASESSQHFVVNQITQQQLEDGSIVDLNKGAEIEARITRDQRLVKLISGEANFKVQKDPSRPFIVEAAGIQLRALGTIFNVRMDDQIVDVVVTEGTVAVRHAPVNSAFSTTNLEESLVRTNYRAIFDLKSRNPQISVDPVDKQDLDREFLWQPRLIDFENAPLSQIVDEFNRRNPVRIEILDDEIGSLRFTSIFWSNNVESFVRLLETNYGISPEVSGEDQILLKKAPSSL